MSRDLLVQVAHYAVNRGWDAILHTKKITLFNSKEKQNA